MQAIKIVDPVTRIEGHMKVEVSIDQNRVVDARCTGTLFRGFENLLKDRSPLDAPVITQRICGVCPIAHGHTSVLALENVSEWLPTRNARLLRNLTLASNYLQSHILHFYLLSLFDYVPGPQASPWKPAWEVDMRPGLEGILDNFAAALEARRQCHEMGAVFGGKMPTGHTFIPGGFTATPTAERIDEFRTHLNALTTFIDQFYIPDAEALGLVYSDYRNIGVGCRNLMSYGVFEMDDAGSRKLLSSGYIEDGGSQPTAPYDGSGIEEAVKYSWYEDNTGNLSPDPGETQPLYPKGDAYSWIKAPRLNGKPFEVGPLARMWINGDYRDGISVIDRHLSRAHEALKVARAMAGWLDELDGGPTYDQRFDQHSGFGVGLSEAPRGALGHWVNITGEGKIENYQVTTPTCWNTAPRDDNGTPGPMEQALIGTPIEDPDRPLEALRVIHSFDPCLSCAVHIMRPDSKPKVVWAGGA